MNSILGFVALAGFVALVKAHTYHLGDCPQVEPMSGFQMNRFLGIWYVMEKTSTASKCITYNYTRGDEPGEYLITQDSNHPVIGLTPLKHEYRYTGELGVPEPSVPALMRVRFPLSVAGTASHIVFATDYDNYAGIFTCQKLAFAHRQSATILSRHRTLDKTTIDRLKERLSGFGVDPYSLSIIPQGGCPHGNDTFEINVDPNTFSAQNIGNAVRKAGEKIGDGVQWVASAGSKVYHKIAGTEESATTTKNDDRLVVPVLKDSGKYETNEVEWIP